MKLGGGGSKFSWLLFLVLRPRVASATATARRVDATTSTRKGLPNLVRAATLRMSASFAKSSRASMASSAVASVVVGSWPTDISEGVNEIGRFMPSSRGGGGSGENAFVRGVVGESMYGFSRVMHVDFFPVEYGVMGALWLYIAVTGRVDGALMLEQSPSIEMGNEPRVGWCRWYEPSDGICWAHGLACC